MKYLIGIVLIILGLKFGFEYLLSDKFQAYADETKAPWTCQLNNLLGEFNITMSHYDRALEAFQPVLARCPKTPMAEDALYRSGVCLEQMGHRSEAVEVYRKYAETYKNTERARIATKSADLLAGL